MENPERFITSLKQASETEIENSLRPKTFDTYVGQDKIKENLKVYCSAAKKRSETLDHVLLYGPAGLGKTTLAHILANEMEVPLRVTSAPAIERSADLAAILTNLQKGDFLFIDEIHSLNKNIEEVLYSAMEDFALDFVVGKGPSAKSMRLSLNPFTLVGATTKAGNLSAPLRDRFGVVERLEMYTPEEIEKIIHRSSSILNIKIDKEATVELAKRSRGTPRIANRLLKRVRDFADVYSQKKIDLNLAQKALSLMRIDDAGLDAVDLKLLDTMITKFKGGPVGLETLAAMTGEDAQTIEDVYEPYLMQLGFIDKTPRGRIATGLAKEHIKHAFKDK